MIIKSIELENIRSYKKELIEFKRGINFLSGDIGSGKSSILQAIEFALFGFKRGDLEGFQLLRKGESKGSIKLNIINTKNDSQIEIYRSLKRSKSSDNITQETGYIKFDDNIVELTPQELNVQVFDLLNFPKEFISKDKNLIYRFTIYTPQEELKRIVFEKPDVRLEVIRKIFGIDKYKQLQEAIIIYNAKFREDKKVCQAKIEPKQRLNDEIKSLREELKDIDAKLKLVAQKEKKVGDNIQKHKLAIEKREVLLEKLNSNLLILEKNKSKIEDSEARIKEIEKEIKKIRDDIQRFDEKKIQDEKVRLSEQVKKDEVELSNLQKQKESFNEKKKDYDNLLKEKEDLNEKISQLRNKQRNYEELKKSFDYVLTQCQVKDLENYILNDKKMIKKLTKLEAEKDEIEKELIRKSLDTQNLKDAIKNGEENIKNITDLNKCNTCYQEIDKSHRANIKSQLEDDVAKSKSDLKQNGLEIKNLKERETHIDKELKQFTNLKDNLIKKDEKLVHLKEKEKKEYELTKKLDVMKKELKKISHFEEKQKELEKKLKDAKKSQQDYERIAKEETRVNKSFMDSKLKIAELENKIKETNNYEKEIKKLNSQLEGYNKILLKKGDILDKLKVSREKEKKLREEKAKLNSNLEKLYESQRIISQRLSSNKTQIENKEKSIADKKKELEEISKIEDQYQKLLIDETFLNEKVANIAQLIERGVFTKYYTEFNENFEELFRDLIEDNDIEVRLDENFSPLIEQNGYDVDIKNLSGGEKSSLAIAYRLGLKKIIESNLESKQKLSLLILDEPTDGFSNEQIDRLGNILKQSSLKQIILVSHDEKIESIADNVLHVEKVNHKSTLS